MATPTFTGPAAQYALVEVEGPGLHQCALNCTAASDVLAKVQAKFPIAIVHKGTTLAYHENDVAAYGGVTAWLDLLAREGFRVVSASHTSVAPGKKSYIYTLAA